MSAAAAPGRRASYEWIDAPGAAARLGVPERVLYRMIDTGAVPGYRIDGRIRLLAHEVDGCAGQGPGAVDPR